MKEKIKNLYKLVRESLVGLMGLHIVNWLTKKNYRDNESFISPNIKFYNKTYKFIRYTYWIFYPVAFLLRRNNIFISINNISWSTGHIYSEIDYLNRMVTIKKNLSTSTVLYIYPKNKVINKTNKVLGTNKVKIILSGIANLILYPLAMRFPEIAIDAGMSAVNHALNQKDKHFSENSYLHIFRTLLPSYVESIKKTSDFYPLKKNVSINSGLLSLIGSENYVVIQIKDITGNATFNPTNPSSYVYAIEHLIKEGYKIVFAGREKMPDIFRKLDVINYAESSYATGLNDYQLVLNSKFVIASGSGFCHIPACLDIPLITINSLQINGVFSRKCLKIPSLLNINGEKIKFSNQIDYYYNIGQTGSDFIMPKGWEVKDASAEDILYCTHEMRKLIENNFNSPLTDLQQKFNLSLPVCHQLLLGLARVSDSFLEQHKVRI